MHAGDSITIEIERIGALTNPVCWSRSAALVWRKPASP